MVNKKLTLSLASILTVALLVTAVGAVVLVAAFWADGSTTMTVVKGQSANFILDVGSFTPPISYTVSLYDASYNLVNTLSTVSSFGGQHSQQSITIASADYGGLGGTYHIVINANDAYDSAFNNQLTLLVTQQSPVVSGLPDVQLEQDTTLDAFDLDSYVSDADDPISSLIWTVTGNDNITVSIDSNNLVTLIPNAGFVGTNVMTFTATDPSGDSGSDQVVVEVLALGTLKSAKKVTIYRLDIESFGDDLIKIRNTGSRVEDVTMQLIIEGEDVEVHRFRFDLDTNRVLYRHLDLEGLDVGTYLARINLDSSDDDDFDKSGYMIIERFSSPESL